MIYNCGDISRKQPIEWCECGAVRTKGKPHKWQDPTIAEGIHGVLQRASAEVATWPDWMRSSDCKK